ncbi:MAG: cytochrome P450 [Halieaceae bacterium]|jgi:pulcherriminic acid synthase|nr:cytochrome P450 [Halieaceae bacterium]
MNAIVDVQSADYHNNLYARYATLREQPPAYFDASRNIWMITRYDDVRRLLRHPEGTLNNDTGHSYIPSLATSDGELHNTIRKAIIPRFSRGVVDQLAPLMEEVVDELFRDLPEHGDIDLYHAVITRLPQVFMTRFLGFPESEADHWYAIGEVLMGVDPESSEQGSPEIAVKVLDDFAALIEQVLEEKRRQPGDDHLSWLVDQEKQGILTAEETRIFANCLGFAGVDTTINLLGNGTGLLAQFPEQRRKLIERPELLDGAIEEMLRMEPPAQGLPRRLTQPLEIDGTVIPEGSEISLMFAAANHDPNHYPDPDTFDIERANKDHLALGFGLHKCIGQHIARLEARAYFPRLLAAYPDYEIVEARWRLSHWARGYAALTIRA